MTTTWIWNTNARIIPHKGDQTMVFNNESGWAARFNGKGLLLIEDIYRRKSLVNGDEQSYPPVLLKLLKDKRVLIDETTADDYYTDINQKLKVLLDDVWRLIILPTERCNFDCYYCYEERIKGKMKKAVADATDKLVARMASEAPVFKLDFFGGEPFLAPDLMIRYLKTAFENAPDKTRFNAAVTTNGSLMTPELLAEMTAYRLHSFQVTLDGPRHMHDKQRVGKNGKGTYDQVVRGIRYLYECDNPNINVSVRVNVHAGLAEQYLPLLEDPIITKAMGDKRFIFSVHEIWESSKFQLSEEHKGTMAAVQKLKNAFAQFELTSKGPEKAKPLLSSPCSEACYAGKPNQFVIYPTGHVGKCTVILEDNRNYIGRVNADGSLEINGEKHDFWIGQNALNDAGCQTCAYRITCTGIGCPINRVKPGDGTCTLRDAYDKKWAHALMV
ncbi:MAG: radical SAM protein [Acidobacteriota bacterium]|nr:radical SAM protein [Acidobacteriota bacterium]